MKGLKDIYIDTGLHNLHTQPSLIQGCTFDWPCM